MDFGRSSRHTFRGGLAQPAAIDVPEIASIARRPVPRVRSAASLSASLIRLLRGRYVELGLIALAVAAVTSLRLTYPVTPKFAIDYVLTDKPGPDGIPRWLGLPHDRGRLLTILGGVAFLAEVVALAIDTWARYRFKLLTWQVQIRFSREVLGSALRLPLYRLQDAKSGGVASLLREDARAPADILFQLVMNLWRSGLQLAGTLVALGTVDVRLSLAAVALLLVVSVSHRGFVAQIQPLYRAGRRTRQEVDAQVAEATAGIRTIRVFQRERSVLVRYVSGSHLMLRHIMRAWWRATYVEVGWGVLIPGATVGVLWYGGSRVLRGSLTLGDLLMFMGYIAMLLRPLAQLVSGVLHLQDDLAGFSRALDVLEGERESTDDAGKKDVDPSTARGHVTVRGVHYAYPEGSTEVLTGLDLELRPGETLALVGPRGAGKTTAVNVLSRFVEPTTGSLLLDGEDVSGLSVGTYRKIVGLVDQDAFLFDGTVRENIAFGDRVATEDDIRRAAAQASALDFISALPAGFDTVVGERGVRLSGGQRQAIALARALLPKPKILILDEATNHLDGESEALILKSVQSLGDTCARLIVSHRLSTVRFADRVALLESGRVVEEGTHAALLSGSPRYREFFRNELLADELGSPAPVSAQGGLPRR